MKPSGDTTPAKTCCAPFGERERVHPAAEVTPASHRVDHDFIRLGGARFVMGADAADGFPADGEGPRRVVRCGDYAIAATTVSNDEFDRFIDATGYVTDAERYGWSFVFEGFLPVDERTVHARAASDLPWWRRVAGATWRTPEGPGSDVESRADHPVVHVSWADAAAYCRWAGVRLPSEAEWEYAARGGLEGRRYAWGDELIVEGNHRCNIWQGRFPDVNDVEDGYYGTAPVNAFEPNGFGLYNVCGNVWEWCSDWFTPDYHRVTRADDPLFLVPSGERSMRGGSFLCHRSYCNRYRVAARGHNTPDSSTSHCGFRVAVRV